MMGGGWGNAKTQGRNEEWIPAYAGMTCVVCGNDGMMKELVNDVSIVIVTHNMQQAARQADRSATTMTRLTPSTIKSTVSS